jgi:hypothetical protein
MTFPLVEVAVVLIVRRGQILTDYNPRWAAFTLPMSKLHDRPAIRAGDASVREEPLDAAIRAAVEVLGRPLPPDGLPRPLRIEVGPYQQSDRDGAWKRYTFHVFALPVTEGVEPMEGHAAAWLTPGKFQTHRPVSPTAVHILSRIDPAELRRTLDG